MIVDYKLCSFEDKPVQLAYIRTSMYGIPFEAYDSTQDGLGSMKSVFGKVSPFSYLLHGRYRKRHFYL